MLCIAPAEGWRSERVLTWGGWARTLVRAFGLESRLPEDESAEQWIEGEQFSSASDGGGPTTRRLKQGASGSGWAMAATSPAEFTWRLRLEKPQVVTLLARTHGEPAARQDERQRRGEEERPAAPEHEGDEGAREE
jgi:hypothetical protein